MSDEKTALEVKALYDEIVAKLGPYIPDTSIPRWDPTAAIDVKINNIQKMLASLHILTLARSEEEYQALSLRLKALAPQSWASMSESLSADEKSKLIRIASAKLAAQERKKVRDERRRKRDAEKATAKKQAAAAAARSNASSTHAAAADRKQTLEKTRKMQAASSADASGTKVILEDEEHVKKDEQRKKLAEEQRLQEQIRIEERRKKEAEDRLQLLKTGQAFLISNARKLQDELGQIDVHDLVQQKFAEEKVKLSEKIDAYIAEIESLIHPHQIAEVSEKITPLRQAHRRLIATVAQARDEQNEKKIQDRKRQSLAVAYGYYGFYKDSDVVGFAPSAKEVTSDEERSKLKFYPVGKHKIVNGKLTIQFDPHFDPHAWNIMTRQLSAPNMFVEERRRYGHEDYAKEFPLLPDELSKIPKISYFLGKGGIVVRITNNSDGQRVEPIAQWSLNSARTQVQISALDNSNKQKYESLIDKDFDPEFIPLKEYRPHQGLIQFSDIGMRGAPVDASILAERHELSGKYYIYEGGHLVFHIGEGDDEKKYVLGKCKLEGNKIKFDYTQLPPRGTDVITGKKHARLLVKNTDFADYSQEKGGVPNAVLDLLPDAEKKNAFEERFLAESRHYSPQPQPDVVIGAVGSSSSPVALDPVSLDKTPGDVCLYSGGIVVEEKTINSKVEKKVVGRWQIDDDEVQLSKVGPEEEANLQGLLELQDYPKSKVKVPNQPAINLSEFNLATSAALRENRFGKQGYYRFEGDGSVWFCPKDQVKEEPNGFFASGSRKRKRESDYPFYFVGHWKLSDSGEVKVTYETDPGKKYAREDMGYFRLLTKDRTARFLGHNFTAKDFRPEELKEATEQMEKYSVAKVELNQREEALASDNKAWHISLKRKEYSVFEDTYSGVPHLGRHIIMTPVDSLGKSQTFWHDTKNNTIGIPPGASIDQQMIDKYVELAGHFCKPKLDAGVEPAKMAIRFSARVRQSTRDAIVSAIIDKYPDMKDNLTIASDEAHFKQLLSKDGGTSASPPTSPRLSAS